MSQQPPAEAKERKVEFAVFLLLIVPPMVLAYGARTQRVVFAMFAVSSIVTDLAFVALVLFFLWRNGEPYVRCGLRRVGYVREILLGASLYPVIGIGMMLADAFFEKLGLSKPPAATPRFLAAHGGRQLALAVVLVLVVAFAEEILFCGYLRLRLGEVQKRLTVAVLLSSALFAMGHAYEGAAGLATVFVLGVVLACIRVWRRSLVAPMVIHALQDFLGIVIAPLAHR